MKAKTWKYIGAVMDVVTTLYIVCVIFMVCLSAITYKQQVDDLTVELLQCTQTLEGSK